MKPVFNDCRYSAKNFGLSMPPTQLQGYHFFLELIATKQEGHYFSFPWTWWFSFFKEARMGCSVKGQWRKSILGDNLHIKQNHASIQNVNKNVKLHLFLPAWCTRIWIFCTYQHLDITFKCDCDKFLSWFNYCDYEGSGCPHSQRSWKLT